MSATLRVLVADDERPARSFLMAVLRSFEDVTIVGEASSGAEAVALIEELRPDLALLDWQMPELDGLGVVRHLQRKYLPLVAFVTAYDEYAVRAFEMNAVDYLLKPVEASRLRETINRAQERIERNELATEHASIGAALETYEASATRPLERIPVRRRDEIIFVPVGQVAAVVAEGELLRISTIRGEQHTISYRLKDLELRLDRTRFVRLGRGSLVNVDCIAKVTVMPGGTHVAVLTTGDEHPVSRLQSRLLRERLFKL